MLLCSEAVKLSRFILCLYKIFVLLFPKFPFWNHALTVVFIHTYVHDIWIHMCKFLFVVLYLTTVFIHNRKKVFKIDFIFLSMVFQIWILHFVKPYMYMGFTFIFNFYLLSNILCMKYRHIPQLVRCTACHRWILLSRLWL